MTLINKYKNDNGSILFVYRKNKNFVKFKILNKNMDFFASSREFLMCEMGNKIDEFLNNESAFIIKEKFKKNSAFLFNMLSLLFFLLVVILLTIKINGYLIFLSFIPFLLLFFVVKNSGNRKH